MSINDLIAAINDGGGMHSPNRYKIRITRGGVPDNMDLFCEAVNIPGVTISTFDYPLNNAEHPVNVPNGIENEDVSMTFMLTNDFAIKKFFDDWRFDIITENYLLNYSGVYEEDITIMVYDQNGNKKYTSKLINAYPTAVNAIALSSATQNDLTRLEVTFTYTRLETS